MDTISGKLNHNRIPRLISEHLYITPNSKQTSDCECTNEMEMFDTHFVYIGQVLLVSVLKMLVTSHGYYKG